MTRPADKIAEMLEDFTPADLDEALSLVRDGRPVQQPSAYDIDVGEEVGLGDDGTIAYSELATIERMIGQNNLLPVHFLTEGADLQGAVGKVIVSPPGWVGTGFMVSPTLLMTNNHVIGNTTDAANTKVKLNFQLDHNGNDQQVDEYRADPDSFFHTNSALDYTIVRLKPKVRARRIHRGPRQPVSGRGVPEVGDERDWESQVTEADDSTVIGPMLRLPATWLIQPGSKWGFVPLPDAAIYAPGQRLNVVQHPRGRRKEVALQSNTVTNIFTNHVRYSTDTEPGSSGSPVFNNAWDLVALHHAAGSKDSSGNWQDNQGVRVDKIVADLKASLGGSTAGQAVLAELGI